MIMDEILPVETHPFEPFLPADAKVLFLGTFPPPEKRWSMRFYYPNRNNDFWRIIGLIFLGDSEALVDRANKTYHLDKIKKLLVEKGIALNDTGYAVRRLKGNASDKFLEIIEPVNLEAARRAMPGLRAIAATGEKAAGILATLTGVEPPEMGRMRVASDGLEVWRVPSTSRAYPLALERKAEYYRVLFRHLGMVNP